jgi:serine/threonine protein kinase
MSYSPRKPDSPGVLAGPEVDLRSLSHYRILRAIGVGGMSEVYLAYDPKLGRQVAIKVLADRLVGNHTFVNRFLKEGQLGKQLTHPNIVKGFECAYDKSNRKYYIVMELVDGPTAQERLEKEGRLPVEEAVRIVIDLARALEYLHHERFVHRDIKPGNILIGPDGQAKLADLGVAKYLEKDQGLTTLDQQVGTPYYMPWEQSVNSSLVDPRSDIFALGATLYHLATGHVPFSGDDEAVIARAKARGMYLPASEHNPQLPAIFDAILERMLARDARKRFASARELIEILTASGLVEGKVVPPTEELPQLIAQPLAPTRADLKAQANVDTPL